MAALSDTLLADLPAYNRTGRLTGRQAFASSWLAKLQKTREFSLAVSNHWSRRDESDLVELADRWPHTYFHAVTCCSVQNHLLCTCSCLLEQWKLMMASVLIDDAMKALF